MDGVAEGESFLNGKVRLFGGDNREILKSIPDDSIDSIVCDPPYALVSIVKRFGNPNAAPAKGNEAYMRASAGFMGKQWDTGDTAHAIEFWQECLRVLKPGGHVVAFAGTRTYHRLACAIEDAGFEIRDMLQFLYGSGFPKSHDVSKGIDRAAGAEREVIGYQPLTGTARTLSGNKSTHGDWQTGARSIDQTPITAPATESARQWQGWGTALKPANEPICLGRKPLSERSVAANVLRWSVGALNIDGCRIESEGGKSRIGEASQDRRYTENGSTNFAATPGPRGGDPSGRWPANVILDGSDEVVGMFPYTTSGTSSGHRNEPKTNGVYGKFELQDERGHVGDSGSAARFFYTAKADQMDRLGSKHPTVKPIDLMQWLVRLVTKVGGTVLDPFAGTGSTAEACYREGMSCILIEREEEYQADIRRRMALVLSGPDERARESIKAKTKDLPPDHGPLFA